VRLRELTTDESRKLIDALLNIEDLPESVSDMILAKAHGNPFFVEEVVRSLIDSGVVYLDGDVWKASGAIESVTVPETVQSVVLTRVDRLEAELRHVLQSASVIGRVFRRRVLERVATQSSDIEQALWELEDHALIYQGRTVPEPEYVFRHALTQDAVYQTVVQRRRAEFHGSVAREMEALYADDIDAHIEQLAYHYELSDNDGKAAEYLLRAGERARRNYLNDEATAYLTKCLEILEALPETEDTARQRSDANMSLRKLLHGAASPEEA
jgi:predicted ATPase